ncbi:MAG: LexA family transcriptional regulator [Mesotoga sp.]
MNTFKADLLGKRIENLRVSGGMTQEQLAEALGKSVPLISLYESGKRLPPTDMIYRIAKYFEVSADYLLGLPDRYTFEYETKTREKLSSTMLDVLIPKHADPKSAEKPVPEKLYTPGVSIYGSIEPSPPQPFHKGVIRRVIPVFTLERTDRLDESSAISYVSDLTGGADLVVQFTDNSMFPTFRKGDSLFIKQNVLPPVGSYVFFRYREESYVRFLSSRPNRGAFEFKPSNPEFETVVIANREPQFTILGIVVGRFTGTA